MNIALIKMSSLGDMVHTLPALTDAMEHGHRFHWIAEEAFAELPPRHPAVDRVHAIAIRRWRKNLWASRAERRTFRTELRQCSFDLALDAQGLIKSAIVGRWLKGVPVSGYDRASVREQLASLTYTDSFAVARAQHAIKRVRSLFAQALGYELPQTAPDFAVGRAPGQRNSEVLAFHGTTWTSKLWPVGHWRALVAELRNEGLTTMLPWGDERELAQAKAIAEGNPGAEVLPKTTLAGLLDRMQSATAAIGVDSGLVHAASAFGLPTVALYGATDPALTSAIGPRTEILASDRDCAPCMARICRFAGEAHPHYPPCFAAVDATVVVSSLRAQLAAGEPS